MKKLINMSCSLLIVLSLMFMLAVTTAAAAVTPSIDYTGTWSDDGKTLVLSGKVNNPDQKFYSGAAALEYDPTLFEVTDDDITAKDNFQIVKKDVDSTNGRIRTDLGYLGSGGGLDPSSTPTEATTVNLKLKNGKTKDDLRSDSVKIASNKDYIDSLGTSYSGGPVTIYGSKSKTDDSITKYGTNDNTASGSVTLPVDKSKEISSIDPINTTTTAGVKPSLPAKVKVTYADGHTEEVAVTWDEIPASSYASAGTFKVSGTVAGTSLKAQANVTVNSAATPSSTTTTTNQSNGGSATTNPTSRTGDNVKALTVMGILLGASVIVLLIVIFSRKKDKGGE